MDWRTLSVARPGCAGSRLAPCPGNSAQSTEAGALAASRLVLRYRDDPVKAVKVDGLFRTA